MVLDVVVGAGAEVVVDVVVVLCAASGDAITSAASDAITSFMTILLLVPMAAQFAGPEDVS